jgi:hypothetical protein
LREQEIYDLGFMISDLERSLATAIGQIINHKSEIKNSAAVREPKTWGQATGSQE